MTTAEEAVATKSILVFETAGDRYAADAGAVIEIVHVPPRITRVPNAPDWMRGVINHRGTIIPILDCARRFGLAASEITRASRILRCALCGVEFGVLVDIVLEMSDVELKELTKPLLEDRFNDSVVGIAELDKMQIPVLDLASLFDIEDLIL